MKHDHYDNSKEYEALGNHLKQEGIEQKFSKAYTKKSDVLAERYNRTLLDKVRSMLQDANLEMRIWGEAALYAAYMINLTIGKAN